MKKHIRLLTFLMALILVLGAALLTPSPARAVVLQTFRVQAGGTSRDYDDFTAAIDWASTYTTSVITLQDDYAYDTAIELAPIGNPNITVDLNGHNLTLTDELYIIRPMSLTFTDSATEKGLLSIHSFSLFPGGTGDIINLNLTDIAVEASGYTMIRAMNNTSYKGSSNVSIENATLSGNSILSVGFNSSASIKDSTLTGSGTMLTLENNGSSYPVVAPTAGASATVENSTLSGNSCIIANELCSLTITGNNNVLKSTNTSFSTISSRGATLNITGTTIDAVFRATDLNGGTATFTDCVLNNTCYMKEDAQATFYDSQISDFYLLDDALAICYDGALSDYVDLYRLRPGGLVHWDTTTSTATVYGEVFLSDDLTIQSGQTFNFITDSVPAKLIPGEHTITSYGTILVDGVPHTHSGTETVEKINEIYHRANLICDNCPISYQGYSDYLPHNETTAASCFALAYCDACQQTYGSLANHVIDPATGLCTTDGCGKMAAAFSLTQNGATTYYGTFADTLASITGTATIQLLADHEEPSPSNSIVNLPGYAITLDLNGKHLQLDHALTLENQGSKLIIRDTSATEGAAGKLSLHRLSIPGNRELVLESGTIYGSSDYDYAIGLNGTLTMTGGRIEAATFRVFDMQEGSSAYISGGYIQALDAFWDTSDLLCTLLLSGGNYGTVRTGSYDDMYGYCGEFVSAILADGYKYVYTATGADVDDSVYQISDVSVVCTHALTHADNKAATCATQAYCGTCQQYYGTLDSDAHDLYYVADDTADTISRVCRNGCDYLQQVLLDIPQTLVYRQASYFASYDLEGPAPASAPVITYYQNDQQLSDGIALPGTYTVKLTLDTMSVSKTVTIGKATVNPYATCALSHEKVYDGTTALPEPNTMAVYITGGDVMAGDDVRIQAQWEFASAEAGTTQVIGKLSLTGADADYYQLATDTLSGDWGKITPANLTITADDKAIRYGDQQPPFSATFQGLIPGESPSDLTGSLSFTSGYDPLDPENRNVGTYTITPDGLSSPNYAITYQAGSLSVSPAILNLAVDDKTVVYGDDAPEFTYTYTGLKFDDTAEDVAVTVTMQCGYTAGNDANTTYSIQVADWDEAADSNYTLSTHTPGQLTVSRRTVEAILTGKADKYYDGTNKLPQIHSLALVLNNVIPGDDVKINGSFSFGQNAVGENLSIFAQNLSLSGEDAHNYYLYTPVLMVNTGTILPLPIDMAEIKLDGQLYYNGGQQTQAITVSKINGLNPTYQVTGNQATDLGLYTLTVTGTGNFSGTKTLEYVVDADASVLKTLESTQLTSEFKKPLEALLDALDHIDPNCKSEGLLAQWETMRSACESHLKRLDAAQDAANTQAISATLSINKNNVEKKDRAALAQAEKDLLNALQNHSALYTETEFDAISNAYSRVSQALNALDRVAQVENAAANVPEVVTQDPVAASNALHDYNDLTDHEKSLLDKKTTQRMEEFQAITKEINEYSIQRLYGNTRYETAFTVAETLKSKLGVSKFQNIIVARGATFADALSGGYLSSLKNAPILLVSNTNTEEVKDYIRQNLSSGGTVYILGGTQAVPQSMETGLDGFKVKRLAGADRYETNLAILRECGVTGKDILLCTGGNFADAVSVAALGKPILLVRDALTPSQLALLKTGSGKITIVGGTKAVSAKVENLLVKSGYSVTRCGGADRYETSAMIAKNNYTITDTAILTSGENYPDALCAGVLARATDAPVILTAPGKEAAAKSLLADKSLTNLYVMGGLKAVPASTIETIMGK